MAHTDALGARGLKRHRWQTVLCIMKGSLFFDFQSAPTWLAVAVKNQLCRTAASGSATALNAVSAISPSARTRRDGSQSLKHVTLRGTLIALWGMQLQS